MVENRTSVQALLLVEACPDSGGEFELPKAVEAELYWIAQEALNNTLKHAQASEVKLYLRRVETHVILEISDNGKGFDPSHQQSQGGMGLSNMRARAEKLGGILKINSQKGKGAALSATKGTTIHVSVEVF